jgi:hypothetical protein
MMSDIDDLPGVLFIVEQLGAADPDFGDQLANDILEEMSNEGLVIPLLAVGINFDTGTRGKVVLPIRVDILQELINEYRENYK